MFERLGEIVVHREVSGPAAATPLVLVNSLGTDLRVWTSMLRHLGTELRTVRYDKRGHGLTTSTPGPYTIALLAADLAALLDRLQVTGALVCGLSIGGMIAQALALARPDLVSALVLMDTAHKIGTAASWQQRMDLVAAEGIEAIADGVMERWFAAGFRRDRATDVLGWRAMLTRTPSEGYLACCAAIRDADFSDVVGSLRLPVLCLVGDEDGSTPPALVEELAGKIPGAVFEVVPSAGHLPCVEHPERMATRITRFAREHDFID